MHFSRLQKVYGCMSYASHSSVGGCLGQGQFLRRPYGGRLFKEYAVHFSLRSESPSDT